MRDDLSSRPSTWLPSDTDGTFSDFSDDEEYAVETVTLDPAYDEGLEQPGLVDEYLQEWIEFPEQDNSFWDDDGYVAYRKRTKKQRRQKMHEYIGFPDDNRWVWHPTSTSKKKNKRRRNIETETITPAGELRPLCCLRTHIWILGIVKLFNSW